MLILLSPSKTLDFQSPLPSVDGETPRFAADANRLVRTLAKLSPEEIARLMRVSGALAARTQAFYAAWKHRDPGPRARPAWAAYQGEVYAGLDASTLSEADLGFAQGRLAILSGLYGVLRLRDAIQPYRLEMSTPLAVGKAADLASFWRPKITPALAEMREQTGASLVVNLASDEYARAVDFDQLGGRVITPSFKEEQGGKYRFLSVYGKRARGLMARWLIEQRVADVEGLEQFRRDGYRRNRQLSTAAAPVFTRPQP